MEDKDLTHIIIGCAMRVHAALGPGLLESAYEACLYYELVESGLNVQRQMPLPLVYKNVEQDVGYRIDLFVEDKVIVELKSVDELHPIHTAQVLTYLKLSNKRLGLLINFNVKSLKDGIKRIIYGYNSNSVSLRFTPFNSVVKKTTRNTPNTTQQTCQSPSPPG